MDEWSSVEDDEVVAVAFPSPNFRSSCSSKSETTLIDFHRLPLVLTGFYRVFTEFYRVLFHFVWFAQGCIGFYWVLLGFAGSWVSSSWKLVFTGFHSIKTGFYWVLD